MRVTRRAGGIEHRSPGRKRRQACLCTAAGTYQCPAAPAAGLERGNGPGGPEWAGATPGWGAGVTWPAAPGWMAVGVAAGGRVASTRGAGQEGVRQVRCRAPVLRESPPALCSPGCVGPAEGDVGRSPALESRRGGPPFSPQFAGFVLPASASETASCRGDGAAAAPTALSPRCGSCALGLTAHAWARPRPHHLGASRALCPRGPR